jgi:potassium/sodium efflux P-type ATPase
MDTPDSKLVTPREIALLSADEAYKKLNSSQKGLTTAKAAESRAQFGTNFLPELPTPPIWKKFLLQFRDLFAVLLLIAAGISFVAYILGGRDLYSLKVCIAILCVVLLNASIGFVQGYMAERATSMLQKLVPHNARVLRDGGEVIIPTTELVPGDIILLEEGDDVPADARLVRAYELSTSEISLTGESTPVKKTADPVMETLLAETELPNLVFMSTTVSRGSGVGIVYGTGLNTQFGRVYRLSSQVSERLSPLQMELATMAKMVSIAAVAIGIVMFVLGHFLGLTLIENLLFALGVMVCLVPEGMPATLTVSLALGVSYMAKGKVLIKRLSTLETLGATTVICTDKTGTLTRGQMTMVAMYVDGKEFRVTGTGYAPVGNIEDAKGKKITILDDSLLEAVKCAALCTTARLVPPQDAGEEWKVIGDPTEGALLTAAAKVGLTADELAKKYPRFALLPFDSGRMRMSSVQKVGDTYMAYIKGAPTAVIERCTHVLENGREKAWSEQERQVAVEQNNAMAERSLRVLALARKALTPEIANRKQSGEIEEGLCFLGLAGLMDPPRADVIEAVKATRTAGLRIIMITGDFGLTADGIAHATGISQERLTRIITGYDLDNLSEEDLKKELTEHREIIFARATPEHKLRVVTALESLGEVVAVTGDGVNDAVALKQADIGIAMGLAGTDVARAASEMVLLDDSFASIIHAVRYGRSIYDNIRRVVIYLFSHNMAELMPYLFATVARIPLVPLNALQVLAIDLGSDVLPALALGGEAPEPDVMQRPPRPRKSRLLDRNTIGRILFLGGIQSTGAIVAFVTVLLMGGWVWGTTLPMHDALYRHAITATQAAIVVSQIFNSFAVRTSFDSVFKKGLFSNRRLLFAQIFSVFLICLISYWQPIQSIFNTAPLTAYDWIIVTGFGALLFAAEEIRKAVLRARVRNRTI